MYHCSQSPPPQFGVIRCLFRYCKMQVHQVDCGDLICCSWCCWERFPFLFCVRTAPGVQLWCAWKVNSKLRISKIKRSDPGEELVIGTGFLLEMMKMFKNWLWWQLHSSVNVLRIIVFYNLKEQIYGM